MTAFDTDILTLITAGDPKYVARKDAIAPTDRRVAVVAAAEVLRGWLAAVRKAEAGRGRISLTRAYEKFDRAVRDLAGFTALLYTPAADAQFAKWRSDGVRIGSQDLRIAAICVAHGVKLATRNGRDYAQVPGLTFELWN